MKQWKNLFWILIVLSALGFTQQSFAAKDADELQREIDVLGQEVQKLKLGDAASAPIADQMQLGFGPAASKVYRSQNGFSIGGYGEILYEKFRDGYDASGKHVDPGYDFDPSTGQSRIDITRAVLYAGYHFSDTWILNSEIEFEHGGSEIDVEFIYLDYFWKKYLNFRAGNLLVPMGLTNETHEPTTYLGSHRPTLETLIIPSTWSECGFGAFGDYGPLTYRSYVVTGMNASGFTDIGGLREGRHERGFTNASELASVTRADYVGIPGLLAGGSVYFGVASTSPVAGFNSATIPMNVFEVHTQYNWHAFDLRAMGAYSVLSNVDQLDARNAVGLGNSVGSTQGGWYLQGGYDLLEGQKMAFIPFVRWELVDTQISVPPGYFFNGTDLIREVVAGINFKPIPQIVLKADYEWFMMGDYSGIDQWNLSMGYVF